MRSNRLLAGLLAGVICLSPTLAKASVAVSIGTSSETLGTTNSLTTTGAVPSGGTLVILTYTTGTNNTPSAGGLTCSIGGADQSGSSQQYTYYCPAPSGLAGGTSITQTYGTSGAGILIAYALPTSVGTFDLGDANDATSTNPHFTTPTPNHSPEYMIVGTFFNVSTSYTPDAADTPLDNVAAGTVNLYAEERVVSPSTSPISYSATLGASRFWMSTWTTFQYTPGGASPHNRTTLGVGN